MQVAENIFARLEKQAKGQKDKKEALFFIEKVIQHLNTEKPLRSLIVTPEEEVLFGIYPFLTRKKVLYLANVAESDLPSENIYLQKVRQYAQKENSLVVPICAKIEEEIAQLAPAERQEFLQMAGLVGSGLDRLIKAAFELLDLITFLTTGEMETKAWTIKKNTPAQEAAGKIHSDIQKGFIRAEVVSYKDMITYNGRVGAREAGKARMEGKNYLVQDGDVILFYHN